jgi:hypothetical protein
MSIRTVQNILDSYIPSVPVYTPRSIILLIDTTYFGSIWVMAFKDTATGEIVHTLLVVHESASLYLQWIHTLEEQWWYIDAIVCDGIPGILWKCTRRDGSYIPTQMCMFHQVAILRRYITKNPITPANKDLKTLWSMLTRVEIPVFLEALDAYEAHYKDFLCERTYYTETGVQIQGGVQRYVQKQRWRYTHKNTRSAFFSLKRNLPFLITSYTYQYILQIPTTTNWLEWYFSHLKSKVRIHRWLKKERKMKLIISLLYS